jgi:hypothetical protein
MTGNNAGKKLELQHGRRRSFELYPFGAMRRGPVRRVKP